MVIAVPLSDNRFSAHFGGADAFALYMVDAARKCVTSTRIVQPPEHGRGVFPAWLRHQGATVILAGGMGPRASSIFESQGIEVQLGVEANDPDAVVQSYIDGTLVTTGELCSDHGFHDCGHHHRMTRTT
jgi:predicted Fe-Mo cluster-binding NifX family protein